MLEVLASLGAADKPKIDVINKIDRMQTPPQWPGALEISAKTGEGIDKLLAEIAKQLRGIQRPARVLVPYAQGGMLSTLHEEASVLSEEYGEAGVSVEAMLDEQLARRIAARLGNDALTWLD